MVDRPPHGGVPEIGGRVRGRTAIAGGLALIAIAVAVGTSLRGGVEPVKGAGMLVEVNDPVAHRDTPPPEAPHVVLVIGCTVRKDQVGVYGGEPAVTPNLDRWAGQGVVFDDMVTAAPWTKPASIAVLTGRHAVEIGMVEPKRRRNERVMPESVPLAAERFGQAGWKTVGVATNPNVHEAFGFHRGFDAYGQPGVLWRDGGVKVGGGVAVRHVLEHAEEQLQSPGPLYLQAMFIDAHAPYVASERAAARFRSPSEPEVLGQYRASLHRFDGSVRKLLAGLEDLGLDSTNTVFFVVNDHGEGLSIPRHHGKSHGRFLAPSTVGGVWLAWGAGVAQGGRVHGVVSQVDILPTLLGLAGVEGYEGPGHNHAELLKAGGGQSPRAAAFTDTWFLEANRAAIYTRDQACQRSFGAEEKGLFEPGCFDRNEDPLHASSLGRLASMETLDAWRAQVEEAGAAGGSERVAPLDPALQDQLEALGYMEHPEDEAQAGEEDAP